MRLTAPPMLLTAYTEATELPRCHGLPWADPRCDWMCRYVCNWHAERYWERKLRIAARRAKEVKSCA